MANAAGGIDSGEDPYQAALRELQEETNVSSTTFLADLQNGTAMICRPAL